MKYRGYMIFSLGQPLYSTLARTEDSCFKRADPEIQEIYYKGIETGNQSISIRKVLIEPVKKFGSEGK